MAHPRTIRPGEMTASQLEQEPQPEPVHAPAADPVERIAVAVTREAIKQLGRGGGWGQWVAIVALAAGLTVHVIGDGTVKAKADRTECLVEWLVERAVAEDRGEPPPQLSPLACAP